MADQMDDIEQIRMPDQSELQRFFEYAPDEGVLYWKAREPTSGPALGFNALFAGKPALHGLDDLGYRRGLLLGRHVRAHRVIWKLVTGEEPRQVDHINSIRSDNRWSNLREVSLEQNRKNLGARKNNKSGMLGVGHVRRNDRWRAYIGVDGKFIHLGTFRTKDEAIQARASANEKYNFHDQHGISGGVE